MDISTDKVRQMLNQARDGEKIEITNTDLMGQICDKMTNYGIDAMFYRMVIALDEYEKEMRNK